MNQVTLKRFRLPTDEQQKAIDAILDNPRGDSLALDMIQATLSGDVRYEVIKVVGSTKPYVGEILSEDYATDLCNQYGMWTITFI